jgi:hypothetical protein
MQFYAVEIARYVLQLAWVLFLIHADSPNRNRNGLNDWIYEKAQEEKNKSK